MKTIFYSMCMLFSMQCVFAGIVIGDKNKISSRGEQNLALSPPLLLEATLYIDQTYVRFGVENSNGRGVTEVYRSLSPDSGFQQVATYPQVNQQFYVEQWNLKPRTTYWYKCRVVDGSEVSTFTQTFEATTLSSWHVPTVNLVSPIGTLITVEFTDNSYNDRWYSIDRRKLGSSIRETVFEFEALDSGNVYYFDDGMLTPGTTYIYYVSVEVYGEGNPAYVDVVIDTATTIIEPPILEDGGSNYVECGNKVPLLINHIDYGPSAEIYRSLSPDGPFTLIATVGPTVYNYVDVGVPRQTNYYKAKSVGPHATSGFSNTISYYARSQYYPPEFSVVANPDGSADVTIVDKSYADEWYHVEKARHFSPNFEFEPVFHIEMTDSGRTYTFHDTTLLAGSGYTYFLTGQTTEWCSGWPGSEGEWDIAEVDIHTPPDDYSITGFTLVDPDIGPLLPGAYFEATKLPNIRANTGPNVKSVIFFLNNKRRTDNGPPIFSYWPEKNGDYQPGIYEEGPYELQATAYSEKNGAGIKGVTNTLVFNIKASPYRINSFTLVDPVTDQDIGPLTNGTVVDASLMATIRANATADTKCVMFFLNNKRHADNGPPTFTYFAEKNGDYQPGLTVPGSYVMKATPSSLANGEGDVGFTVTIQFQVSCSACASSSDDDMANARTIDLYPNPVVKESQLIVNTTPQTALTLQVYDQFGNAIGTPLKSETDSEGGWKYPVTELNLRRGAYIINVVIDGERHMKRIVVD
jgi:hypothetical protein